MNTNRRCGCKSFNSCYLCEAEYGLEATDKAMERIESIQSQRIFCPLCRHLYDPGHLHLCRQGQPFQGIEIHPNFVSEVEETQLIHQLDLKIPWSTSQSGRRKQNFGPKANFRKRKAKVGDFRGYPLCTKFIQDKFPSVPSLKDYRTVEQCSIEYRPETGARIDPHIDDCWIWGERIVQLNLLSDSVLTLFPYHGDPFRYNLNDVSKYPKVMNDQTGLVDFNPFKSAWSRADEEPYKAHSLKLNSKCDSSSDMVIRIPLPRRSLLVMYGEPRYDWEHCILRRDIINRRVVIAYREFTPTYLPNGSDETLGKQILDVAENFFP